MRIKRGYDGGFYAVFKDEPSAMKWQWLFCGLLRRQYICFGAPYNAFELWSM